jgi:hypothetical protein
MRHSSLREFRHAPASIARGGKRDGRRRGCVEAPRVLRGSVSDYALASLGGIGSKQPD